MTEHTIPPKDVSSPLEAAQAYNIPTDATALRPVRIDDGHLITYPAWDWFSHTLLAAVIHTMHHAKHIAEPTSDIVYAVLDVLDNNGDILLDFCLTQEGFAFIMKMGERFKHNG